MANIKNIFIVFVSCICLFSRFCSAGGDQVISEEVDSNGCMSDSGLTYSCFDMETVVTGVMGGTAGCVERSGVPSALGSGYTIVNGSWSSAYPGYAKFCFCEGTDSTNVTVMPCGTADSDCVSGYHWDSNTGCVQDIGCNDCSSTGWGRYSDDKEKRVDANCDRSTGNCNKTSYYRCAQNYYSGAGLSSTSSESSLNCISCPNGGTTSTAGSTSVNACTGGGSTPTPVQPTCTPSTTCNGAWNNSGSFQNQSCVQTFTDCSKNTLYQYRCAAGYYAASGTTGIADSANSLNCTRCPKILNVQSTSNPGSVGKSACCISSGVTGNDGTGTFVIETTPCCAE